MNLKLPKLNTEVNLFCPRRSCPCYQSLDNTITKDGVYTTINDKIVRQMFYCANGKHRFSETGYSALFGCHGSFKEYVRIPVQSCHPFQTNAATDSILKLPLIPVNVAAS
jgi:threonine dehydrogenase-like Zn-dependent dehydrogenase